MIRRELGLMVIAALFGFLGGWSATYFLSPPVVTAQVGERFPLTTTGVTIINQAGQPRASLTLWDGEHPALVLSDARCARRAELIVSPQEHTALTMFGKDCKRRVAVDLHANDLPSFVLRDQRDIPRVVVQLLSDGSPVLDFLDANGNRIKSMP